MLIVHVNNQTVNNQTLSFFRLPRLCSTACFLLGSGRTMPRWSVRLKTTISLSSEVDILFFESCTDLARRAASNSAFSRLARL